GGRHGAARVRDPGCGRPQVDRRGAGGRAHDRAMKLRTRLAQKGRKAKSQPATVNLPVVRASTVTFASIDDMEAVQKRFEADQPTPTYGIVNMPLRTAFEELMVEVEGGHRAVTLPSGLAAVAVAIMAAVKAGDHVLIA